MAEQPAGARLGRLGHHRRREQRQQEEEQNQHPAALVHRGQDPQRFLQQAERQVRAVCRGQRGDKDCQPKSDF